MAQKMAQNGRFGGTFTVGTGPEAGLAPKMGPKNDKKTVEDVPKRSQTAAGVPKEA